MRTKLWELNLKTDYYYICKNHPIWEPDEFEKIKNLENLVGSHQPKKAIILENQSDSHNMMQEPELANSHKKLRTTQHWFIPCPNLSDDFKWCH